jgi:hypothetical protein
MSALKEADHGVLLAKWLTRRGVMFVHIPNEGVRSVATATSLIRQGLQPGAPDYLIFDGRDGGCGVAIELKRVGWKPKNRQDKARFELQKAFLAALDNRGWCTRVCYGWEDAVAFLESLGY